MGKASYAEIYNMPQAEYLDMFSGVQFTLVVNGLAKSLVGATIEMTIKGLEEQTLSIGNGITLVNAAAGVFNVDAQIITLRPGKYTHEIKFTFAGGIPKTYIEGTWIITR